MKKSFSLIMLLLLSIGVFSQSHWKVDPSHSSINFGVTHSGISLVNGKFLEYTGELTTTGEALTGAQFDFTVNTQSVDTSIEGRDNHLRNADFFDTAKFPTMTFKSTKIESTDKANQYLLHGLLTIKDVTKEVVFDVHFGGIAKGKQGEKLGMKAKTTINRFDYNINYDPTAAGIGKEVKIVVHLQFAKQ